MTGPRTPVAALQPARASFVRHCARNAGRVLATVDRASDAELAAIVAAAIHELRQAETELAWHDIAPATA